MRGIGSAVVGGAGGIIMGLVAWLIPEPSGWLRYLGWGLLVVLAGIFLYGLILIIRSYRKTQVEIQEKDAIISEQRERLSKLRERLTEPALLEIPDILTDINKLNKAISSSAIQSVTEKQINDLEDSILQGNILKIMSWLGGRKNMSKLLDVLITLSTEMNNRSIGLRASRLADYEALLVDLDDKRKVIGNPLLKRRIREYLAWSDGVHSFRLLFKYHFSTYKLPKWFPSKIRVSDDKMLLAIEAQMDEALGQVVKAIEETLVGRSDSGTGNV